MGAVAVAERVGRGRGDHGNIDVNFAVLYRLPASTVGAQHSHATHLALRAIVAERAVHAALNVIDDTGFHQCDGALLRWERGAGEPHQVFRPDQGCGFECHESDSVAVAEVMMGRDDHAIAQTAFTQRGFEIRDVLVSIRGILGSCADRRRRFASWWNVLAHTLVRDLWPAIYQFWNNAAGCVYEHFSFLENRH
jgi:hypothetical protein